MVSVALLLVLGLLLSATGCDKATGPEKTVQRFLTAMENKDIDDMLEIFGPEFQTFVAIQAEAIGMELEDVKAMLTGEFFPYDSMKFSGVEMMTTELGDGTAKVTITAGSYALTTDGETVTRDVSEESDVTPYFYLYEADGVWVIDYTLLQ
jgi:ketosteroid isomerase-like protein